MTPRRQDADQACRYLKHARELLFRDAERQTVVTRQTIEQVEQRLSPGDQYLGDAPAEITVLRMLLDKLQTLAPSKMPEARGNAHMMPGQPLPGIGEAGTDISKAISILRRGSD